MWHNAQAEDCKCHGQYCLLGIIWSGPPAGKHLWPQYERRYTSENHVSFQKKKERFLGEKAPQTYKRPSLRQPTVNHCHRRSCRPSPTPPFPSHLTEFLLVGFWRLEVSVFFSLFPTRQILREADVKTGQSRDEKNINTFFFIVQGEGWWWWRAGGWGARGRAVGSVKETRTLSQPSSSVIRRHDKVAAWKTLQVWHNPKTD